MFVHDRLRQVLQRLGLNNKDAALIDYDRNVIGVKHGGQLLSLAFRRAGRLNEALQSGAANAPLFANLDAA